MSEGEEINSSPLYKDDPVWADVKPIYPSKAEIGVVRIIAGEAFTDAFAFLRAVLVKREISERCFSLTTECIQQNPANYTVWQYRRDLLKELNKDKGEELKYISEIIMDNPKNYQVWHHRRAIIEWIGNAGDEMVFTSVILEDEPKNYHAWQHRQWVVRRFYLASQREVDFSTKLILEDPRNNSGWNYRYFILQLMNTIDKKDTLDIEINLCKQLASKMPHNESVWNYLAGLLINSGLTSRQDVIDFVEEQYAKQDDQRLRSPYLVSMLVDVLMEKIEKGIDGLENVERVKVLLQELVETDPVRVNYWNYQKNHADNLYERYMLKSKQF